MSGGFHVSVFDLDAAESIHTEAPELALSLNFMPTIVSSGIDLLFVHLRRMDLAPAQALLPEVEGQVAGLVFGETPSGPTQSCTSGKGQT